MTSSTDELLQPGSDDLAVVLVHGFLDDRHAWDDVVNRLVTDVETIQVDLYGCGEKADVPGPFTYDRLAAEVGAVVDRLDKPFVIVGQSMGAAIAELVAADRHQTARGLVLMTPVPLAGTNLPDEAVEPFRSLGERGSEAQRAARRQLSVALADDDLDRLVEAGTQLRPEVVRELADTWNNGHNDGQKKSRYGGPVLVLRGSGDPFVTDELTAAAVVPRFTSVRTEVIEDAGHWAHVEQPAQVAAVLDTFIEECRSSAGGGAGWTRAFAEKSADSFAEAFAEDVVLEAAVLMIPVEGRGNVKQVMGVASNIYDALEFTHEATKGDRTYLEWEAVAFGEVRLSGITVLTRNEAGQVTRAAIHHRPLSAGLRFSAELRRRLAGVIDAAHFYPNDI
ncbi:alpha/beta fold hydrolase [Pedococcus sp. 5OH_020]|uniref:alpha/beta fold hydrolase n=1 Tax=Pedococcus sp. 5OH_020 TaxID=2989814 RepID=UPI0022E9C6AA|nr:alpha/beta hydrolase [Pedococcus sp. 5OH_020]